MILPPDVQEEVRKQVIAELWRRGELSFKLHETQRKIYTALQQGGRRHFICCSRRLGKSYLMFCLALEKAIKEPGARVLYVAPWTKDAAEIAGDLAAQILTDCPADMRPEYRYQDKAFQFPNGSVIRFKGVNGETAETIRGFAAHLVILDEAGSMDNFAYTLNSVVAPLTLTTRGRIIIATTPAKSPGHDSGEIYEQLARKGDTSLFTIRDAPHLDHQTKREILVDTGESEREVDDILAGKKRPKTTAVQREYFCEWVTEAGSAVVPEFDAQAKEEIVVRHPAPPYRDRYVAMDPGMRDKTGILFGYWDISAGKFVIEDEALLDRAGTSEIATTIRQKEQALWGEVHPYMRISDIEHRLIADLTTDFGIPFVPTMKKDSWGAVLNMRNFVKSRELVILPNCVHLIRQLERAVWNNKVTDFERPDGKEYEVSGHFDLVAALKYMLRGIVKHHNPYPSWYSGPGAPRLKAQRGPNLRVDTPLARRFKKRGE